MTLSDCRRKQGGLEVSQHQVGLVRNPLAEARSEGTGRLRRLARGAANDTIEI